MKSIGNEVSRFKRLSFPYVKGNFERLKSKLKKFKLELVAKPPPKLKHLLYRPFDPVAQDDLARVYEIPYENEGGILIIILV